MKHPRRTEWPAWLREADTVRPRVEIWDGTVVWLGGQFRDGYFLGGYFRGGQFLGGEFLGGEFWGGEFRGGEFRGGEFLDGEFRGGYFCDGEFRGGEFRGGEFCGGYFCDGEFRGGKFRAGYFLGGEFRDGEFRGGYFCGGEFLGGEFLGVRARALRCFYGLYRYSCAALLDTDGVPWVRMGCLLKKVEEWEQVGIRESNLREFPDDGSARSEERVRVFEFVRAAALDMQKAGAR